MKNFAIYDFDFGTFKIEYSNEILLSIEAVAKSKDCGVKNKFTELVYTQLQEYFSGIRTDFTIPYHLEGTDFQKKVWTELVKIPYGETRTYKDIANSLGNENSSRAVGNANNKNKLPILIPCHRVIGANGKLVGYAGGLELKEKLLTLEKSKIL